MQHLPGGGDEREASTLDRFILDRLDREGLAPSPEADPETLVRRVYLDLTGLPPTPEEVDAYLEDERPDRFERLVDQLLQSPSFGEHMADSGSTPPDTATPTASTSTTSARCGPSATGS